QGLYSSLRNYLDDSGFPPVFNPLDSAGLTAVAPPDPALENSPTVAAASPMVVKVRTMAWGCDRQIEGSGFVYAPQYVLTNAHVVAGESSVSVLSGGGSLSAKVVLYDDQRDVAVLHVPGLKAPALPFADAAAVTNDDAIVLGYPQDGPYDARSARVSDHETLHGKDIYGANFVDRDVYAIRALVRGGNSGGPLLTPDGQVLGMVFAAAVGDDETGFVLSDAELRAAGIDAAVGATKSVGTGACTPS
ncbi:MAG: MarP family serine protease, partial [Frankiaceae bacterium]|nr:MarP family serine protease [Frankiaceae bacterium]